MMHACLSQLMCHPVDKVVQTTTSSMRIAQPSTESEAICMHAGCVFTGQTQLNLDLYNPQCYFKNCTLKTGSTGYGSSPVSFQMSTSAQALWAYSWFPAVAFENMVFDMHMPKNISLVELAYIEGVDATADKHVYSDAPVNVLSGTTGDSSVVQVGGNLDAAAAVTPPLNRPFLSSDDALLKQYQAESVRPPTLRNW